MAQVELKDCCSFLKSKIFQEKEKNSSKITILAELSISENHLNCFKIIVKNSRNFLIQKIIFKALARSGNLNFLKFFDSQNFSWKSEDFCWLAAESGHLNIIKWAIEKDCPFVVHHCVYSAIDLDKIDILFFFVDKGFPLDPIMCSVAAENGKLEMLKFLKKQLCPWDERTPILAAENGHLDVLKWAFENDCPINEEVIANAFKNGHQNCLDFALKNNFPTPIGFQQNDIPATDEKISLNCSICDENQRSTIFLPCGHSLCCWSCSVKIDKKCPNCRHEIDTVHKIFLV
jgi:hypothetical protein